MYIIICINIYILSVISVCIYIGQNPTPVKSQKAGEMFMAQLINDSTLGHPTYRKRFIQVLFLIPNLYITCV